MSGLSTGIIILGSGVRVPLPLPRKSSYYNAFRLVNLPQDLNQYDLVDLAPTAELAVKRQDRPRLRDGREGSLSDVAPFGTVRTVDVFVDLIQSRRPVLVRFFLFALLGDLLVGGPPATDLLETELSPHRVAFRIEAGASPRDAFGSGRRARRALRRTIPALSMKTCTGNPFTRY